MEEAVEFFVVVQMREMMNSNCFHFFKEIFDVVLIMKLLGVMVMKMVNAIYFYSIMKVLDFEGFVFKNYEILAQLDDYLPHQTIPLMHQALQKHQCSLHPYKNFLSYLHSYLAFS